MIVEVFLDDPHYLSGGNPTWPTKGLARRGEKHGGMGYAHNIAQAIKADIPAILGAVFGEPLAGAGSLFPISWSHEHQRRDSAHRGNEFSHLKKFPNAVPPVF